MTLHLLDLLRRFVVGGEDRLARRSQHLEALGLQRERQAFERNLLRGDLAGRVVLGRGQRLDGTFGWVSLPRIEFLGRHWWWSGGSGGGKSFSVLGVLLQLLSRDAPPTVVSDSKGELAALLRTEVLPVLASRPNGEELLKDLRMVRPFDGVYVPHLRITAPEPGVPVRIQAVGIGTSLAEAVGGELGHRMLRVFTVLSALAIERGEALTRLVEWLRNPAALARAGRDSRDPELRAYAFSEFPKENKESIRALQARLGDLLFIPQARACFEAPACLSFHDCLERGVTLFDASDPPGGVERAKQLVESLIIGRLTRAILSRPVTDTSPHALVILEEFQESVRAHELSSFGRLVAQARYKRIALGFVNQQPSQIDPDLRKLLRTNCTGEVAFRCSRADAEALAHALPFDVRARSAVAARDSRVRELTRLPQRHCLLWLKDRPYGAQLMRSPRIDLAALRSAAAVAPADLFDRIRRGIVAEPREAMAQGSAVVPRTQAPAFETSGALEPDERFPALG